VSPPVPFPKGSAFENRRRLSQQVLPTSPPPGPFCHFSPRSNPESRENLVVLQGCEVSPCPNDNCHKPRRSWIGVRPSQDENIMKSLGVVTRISTIGSPGLVPQGNRIWVFPAISDGELAEPFPPTVRTIFLSVWSCTSKTSTGRLWACNRGDVSRNKANADQPRNLGGTTIASRILLVGY